MAKLIMTVEQMQDHDKWLEVRNKGIGGSDAGIIAGVNLWKKPYELWLNKTNQVEAEDISSKDAVHFGNILEQVVADEFCLRTGKKVRKCGTLQDDEYEFLLANVDRMVVGENAGLECKTASAYSSKYWEDDEVPDSYYLQCQHYMMITGCERWYIACLIGGQKFIWKTIERNEDDIKALKDLEIKFWQDNVIGMVPPPVDGSDACTAALTGLYPGGEKKAVANLDSFKEHIEKIAAYKQSIKDLEDQVSLLQNQIKEEMGDIEKGSCGEYKISWASRKGNTTIDKKALEKDLPDVYAKYLKVGKPYRAFSIK